MASSFPGSLDSFTNPTSTDAMDASAALYHDTQHANINDAVEAVQAELGTDPAGAQATVKARLDSAEGMLTPMAWPKSGAYFNGNLSYEIATTVAVVANRLHYEAFWCPTSVTLSALALEVTTLSSGNVRMGIYTATRGSDGLVPSSLLVDAGTAATGTTGVKEVATTQALTGQTWYFISAVFDATPTLSRVRGVGARQLDSSIFDPVGVGYYESFTYGALPSTPGTMTITTVAADGRFAVKL
jgi:hypothetical protein